ncbi:MAG: MFS transporter [Desulfovibrio sp.]|nr:MFS transporter [Desulfovibrio sp.]
MLSRARYILLNAYHILIDGLFDAVPILLAFMVLSFGEGEKAVGLIVSVGTAAGTAAGLGTLLLARKLGFMQTITLVTAVCGAGFCAATFSGNIVVAGLCFILAVTGYNVFHNIAFSYLTLHTERRRLGRVMSDFTAIGDVGRIPLVSLAAFVAAYSFGGFPGWRMVCITYGAAALAAAFWLFVSCRGERPETREEAPGGRNFPAFGMFRDREIFLAMFASILNAFSNDRIFTFLPLLLIGKEVDPTIIGSFALGFSVGSFLGKMACGRFVDSFGPRKVFVAAELLLTALLCALIMADQLVLIVSSALLLGIVTKGTVPVIQAIITEPVRDAASYGDVFSINSFLRGITNMLTPLLFGFLASAWSMNAIYAIMAVAAAVAAVPVLLMRRFDSAR